MKIKRIRVDVMTYGSLFKTLTDKRLEILRMIKKKYPSSVYELAKILNRDAKNVTQDLEYLKQIGLVEIKRTKEKKELTIPEVDYDLSAQAGKIDLEIAMPGNNLFKNIPPYVIGVS